MANIKDVSGNTLSELNSLLHEIETLINVDYSHITEHLPNNVLIALATERERITAEYDRRYFKQIENALS